MSIEKDIKRELMTLVDLEYKKGSCNFFKKYDEINIMGVRYPKIREIANKYWKEKVSKLDKKDVFKICSELLESKNHEEIIVAFQFIEWYKDKFVESDFELFKKWIEKYITNWASCDDFCCGAFGEFLMKYPLFVSEVRKWWNSKNRWLKRASIVGLIRTVQKTGKTDDVYKVADLLLADRDDLIQKGSGWT